MPEPPVYQTRRMALYELAMLQKTLTLTHMPRMTAFTVFFLMAAYTLNWRWSLAWAGIVWLVLLRIFRLPICRFLSERTVGTCLETVFFGWRWIVAIICAAVIWFRTSATGWDGWWQLLVVVLIDLLATFVLDARELAYTQSEIERVQAGPDVF